VLWLMVVANPLQPQSKALPYPPASDQLLDDQAQSTLIIVMITVNQNSHHLHKQKQTNHQV
jgi:hypothetical protein